jgi:hypothetical protein
VAPHVHSEWSYDAHWPLPRLARLFRRLGYGGVLMTEHDRGFDQDRWDAYREACAAASSPSMVLVPGIEYSDPSNLIHVPVWGSDDFLGEGTATGELLERATAAGASAVFAHPWRGGADRAFDAGWADRLLGVEWWNRKYDGYAPRPEAGRALAARGAVPFVGIDFHTSRQLVPFAMVLELDGRPTVTAALGALRGRRCRPEVLGVSALRLMNGRGRQAAGVAEGARRLAAAASRRL